MLLSPHCYVRRVNIIITSVNVAIPQPRLGSVVKNRRLSFQTSPNDSRTARGGLKLFYISHTALISVGIDLYKLSRLVFNYLLL